MTVLRTLFASVLILAAGVATLAAATDGFRAFTSVTARRVDVREHPRALPSVPLQTAGGQVIDLASLRGRWVLVDFIYTRCRTYCSLQGSVFARLQQRLAQPITRGEVMLLSVSFDPTHDTPARLADYKQHFGDSGEGWVAARPTNAPDLETLMQVFSVTVIPDPLGGYVHSAAIWVVDPRGRLVAILDRDAIHKTVRYVLDGLAG